MEGVQGANENPPHSKEAKGNATLGNNKLCQGSLGLLWGREGKVRKGPPFVFICVNVSNKHIYVPV